MKNVYILTEAGREYSKAGCDYITKLVKEGYKDDSELIFSMGGIYNNPKYLEECIKDKPDCYVAISRNDGLPLLKLDETDIPFRNKLLSANGKTSWQIAYDYYMELVKKDQNKKSELC